MAAPGSPSPPTTRNPGRIRNRADRLEVAIIVNQLATPGLGSWAAGYRVSGAGQLVLATAGFVAGLIHFARSMSAIWDAAWKGLDVVLPDTGFLIRGMLVFGVAWVWAGYTSLQMVGEIRRLRATPGPDAGIETPPPTAPPHLRTDPLPPPHLP